jgi:SAM-dependent methyltransferase
MNNNLLHELLDFYQDQLLLGFYRKRGKSIAIPHILFSIERLLEKNGGRKVKLLDVGCGKGDLLAIINQVAQARGYSDKLILHGIDNNQELIRQIAPLKLVNKLFLKDLRYDLLDEFVGKYDVVVSINTIHEVFSQIMGENETFSPRKFKSAKKNVEDLIIKLCSFLTSDGSFIFYDGMDVPVKQQGKQIQFKIKTPQLLRALPKFVREYVPWKPKLKKVSKDVFELSYRDFVRFVTTFRYMNTELWLIERRESYAYFDIDEFRKAFRKGGLHLESMIPVGNDLGLWGKHIELIDDNDSFPIKALLLVTSKSFVSSVYDYFEV